MAVFNLAITYPDAQQARILTALRAHFATAANPTPTNAQIQEAMRQEVIRRIKGIVQAEEAAALSPVDPT